MATRRTPKLHQSHTGYAKTRAEVPTVKADNEKLLAAALAFRGYDSDSGTFTHEVSADRSSKLSKRAKGYKIEVVTTWTED